MSNGGKGSTQRPTDKAAYDEGYERIFRKPEGAFTDPMCAWPFCDCKEKCEEVKSE